MNGVVIGDNFFVMGDSKPEALTSGTWKSWDLNSNYKAPPKPTCGGSCIIAVKLTVAGISTQYIYSFGGLCTKAVQRYDLTTTKKWEKLADMPGDLSSSTSCAFLPTNSLQIMVSQKGSSRSVAIFNLITNRFAEPSVYVPSSTDLTGSDLLADGSDYNIYAIDGGIPRFTKAKKYSYTPGSAATWPDVSTGTFISGNRWSTSTVCVPITFLTTSGILPSTCTGF